MSDKYESKIRILGNENILFKTIKQNSNLIVEKILSFYSLWKTKNMAMLVAFLLNNFLQIFPTIRTYLKYRRYKYRTCAFDIDVSTEGLKKIKSLKCDGVEKRDLILYDWGFTDPFVYIMSNNGYSASTAEKKITIKYDNVVVKYYYCPVPFSDHFDIKKILLATNYQEYEKVTISSEGAQKIKIHKPSGNGTSYSDLEVDISFDKRLYPFKSEIISIVDNWKDNKKRFKSLGGLPMNFLFSGPPGTGKSVLAVFLTTITGLKNVRYPKINADGTITNKDPNSVLIFDDLDILYSYNRDNENIDSKESIHRAKVLVNLMDLLDSPSKDTFIVITTNYPDRLDPVLLRPGRISYRFEFGPLSFDNCLSYAEEWYKEKLDLKHMDLTSAELITLIRRSGMDSDKFVRNWNDYSRNC